MDENSEGTLIVGPGGKGIPFTDENVRDYIEDPRTTSGAIACLKLTMRHRAELDL